MKYYLSDLITRLKKYSVSLDQSAFLVDKPWVVSNNSGPFEKLIFRRDGKLHLSSDGSVTDGQWEYLPEAQSLIIDFGEEKKLYKHQYLDEAVLALKQDGNKLESGFFLLANENVIPNTNAKKYLRDKYLRENNIEIKILGNGKELELQEDENQPDDIYKKAFIDGVLAEDGTYFLKGNKKKIKIKDGRVIKTLHLEKYDEEIFIWQGSRFPQEGDSVEGMINGQFKTDINGSTYTIKVKDRKVLKANTDDTLFFVLLIAVFLIIILILMAK